MVLIQLELEISPFEDNDTCHLGQDREDDRKLPGSFLLIVRPVAKTDNGDGWLIEWVATSQTFRILSLPTHLRRETFRYRIKVCPHLSM